ncbi:hypothetical protein QT971_00050 [Microcoleus sp. herbarium19]|uniref:hypothetical protein n=1 Tax=unclassified Microcoleus TaxID=2642155 RepID=UPI002FD3DD22
MTLTVAGLFPQFLIFLTDGAGEKPGFSAGFLILLLNIAPDRAVPFSYQNTGSGRAVFLIQDTAVPSPYKHTGRSPLLQTNANTSLKKIIANGAKCAIEPCARIAFLAKNDRPFWRKRSPRCQLLVSKSYQLAIKLRLLLLLLLLQGWL